MTIDERNIIWLDLFPNLPYSKKKKLLEITPKGQDIKQKFLSNLAYKEILSENEFKKMSVVLDNKFLDDKIAEFERNNIKMITIYNPEYPTMLANIADPPLCLYCRGNTQLLNTLCVAIVGTRKPSEYGIVTTKQFAKELVENDVTIVSGMAVGVDTLAHKTALENNGKTIAVLAGGLYHIYPAVNFQLSKTLAENNLILSENSPDTTPQAYNFPIRNRIIAGLSRAVLVTEAGEKSGSLHTINYAIDYGRDIFAIPGRINSPNSVGCNNIIKEYSGSIALSPDDILAALDIKKQENSKITSIQLDLNEQIILNYIMAEKKTFQEIADHTGMPVNELNATLLNLEVEGLITKLANNSYIKS